MSLNRDWLLKRVGVLDQCFGLQSRGLPRSSSGASCSFFALPVGAYLPTHCKRTNLSQKSWTQSATRNHFPDPTACNIIAPTLTPLGWLPPPSLRQRMLPPNPRQRMLPPEVLLVGRSRGLTLWPGLPQSKLRWKTCVNTVGIRGWMKGS